MKLLPFDLEKAQAGHPWGTRDGRKGKKIFDTERNGDERLIAVLETGEDKIYNIKGRYGDDFEKNCDLFLYEETKKGWVVIFRVNDYIDSRATNYESNKNQIEETYKAAGTYLKTVEVEY